MKVVGIICEYNPFHNGHIYHLSKVKELFPDSLVILVMSGHFTQRGIPSIINKWDKTSVALKYGIDLVIELPFAFATQGADIFAHGSIAILKALKTEYLVFGSENNQIDKLIEMAHYTLENVDYQKKVKKLLDEGYNYPTALNMAFPKMYEGIKKPNDLLAFSYIKEIIKQNASIKPISIKRTNSYHNIELEEIASATSIRNAIANNKNISDYVPNIVVDMLNKEKHLQNDYFPFLKYKILTSDNLSIYQTVDEGIDKRIKKYIVTATNWEELVQSIKTKRYTYNRINRMLIHILCDFTKDKAEKWQDISYIRVLGFNDAGQKYLNKIKKELSLPLITTFSKSKDEMLQYEQTVTGVYSCILNEIDKNNLIGNEYKNQPKMRK